VPSHPDWERRRIRWELLLTTHYMEEAERLCELFFASNALYPAALVPAWVRAITRVNPLGYEVYACASCCWACPATWPRSSPFCWAPPWSGSRPRPGCSGGSPAEHAAMLPTLFLDCFVASTG
jgi:hypothetical protein